MDEKAPIYELQNVSFHAQLEGNKRASAYFGIKNGYPRITVFPGTDPGTKNSVLIFAFDMQSFLVFLTRFEALVRGKTVAKEKMDVKYRDKDPKTGKPFGEPKTTAELFYGLDEDLVPWFSVVQPDRPRIVFKTTMSDYQGITNSSGKQIEKSEAACLVAMATFSALKQAFINIGFTTRDIATPRVKAGGGSASSPTDKSTVGARPATSSFYGEDDVPY